MAGPTDVRLIERRKEADGTESFVFERPAGFDFTAGQYLEMTLGDPGLEAEAAVHFFSISSPPRDASLSITTRLRDSPFKNALRRLGSGDTIRIEGPFGVFTPGSETDRPLALIAGGIGVTPMRSMVLEAAGRDGLNGVFLFYSNRLPEQAAFLNELQGVAEANAGFRLVATMSDVLPGDPNWQGECGRLDLDMIARYLDPAEAIYFVSGPPPMVSGLRDLLLSSGVPGDRVRVERFDGY